MLRLIYKNITQGKKTSKLAAAVDSLFDVILFLLLMKHSCHQFSHITANVENYTRKDIGTMLPINKCTVHENVIIQNVLKHSKKGLYVSTKV